MRILRFAIPIPLVLTLAVLATTGCSVGQTRGIADKRSNFGRFIPMESDAGRDGLREVKPYFRAGDRAAVMRAIERACQGGRSGSSVYDPRRGAGYYVNCNPQNRQLLNGYVPSSAARPHSR